MKHPKPPPQTLRSDDEKKIQVFLERASSIVLERPVLDLAHWRRLVTLAEELGLSDDELQSTVHDLRQRGVISEIDLSPPKPPPLPSKHPQPTADTDIASGPEQHFSLQPPTPPPPPAAKSPQVKVKVQSTQDAASPSSTAATSSTAAPEQHRELSKSDRTSRYVDRAEAIIAEQRGFGQRTQALLAALAEEMGLDQQEAAVALQSNRREPAPSPPPPPDNDTTSPTPEPQSGEASLDHRRWRVEGSPPPEPPPPTRKPEQIYRDYLSASLGQITNGLVPVILERKFIKHGTSVLGLAKTFARHLVHEEAAEKNLRFESDRIDVDPETDSQAGVADGDALCDTNVKLFLERSVPILSLHRGINAKSRVLLNALATELGLSDEQVEQAIAATQFRTNTSREDADALQEERLVGFRELVQGALISLPRKLLTFDVEENLQRHGVERHGITPALVGSAIREVCRALDIRQISEQQAREHIEHLVDAKLIENARLQREVCARVEAEGKQWGLNAEQVGSIIKERTRLQDKRTRSERNFTHASLWAASLAALIVIGFFGWVAVQSDPSELQPIELDTDSSALPVPIVVDDSDVDSSWWGEELEFAMSAARRELRSQRVTLVQVESKQPSERTASYEKLTGELFGKTSNDERRDLLIRVLSLCYARDPDRQAARQILDGLVARIPRTERDLRADDSLYAQSYSAAQAVVSLVSQSSSDRQMDATSELGRAIGRTIDATLDPTTLEQHAYEGVSERLYQLLIALAKSDPARVASSHAIVAEQAAVYLDPAKIEKLNTDFLVVALAGDNPLWRPYEELIRRTVASKSGINVVRLLEIYETTPVAELQAVLGEALVARIDKEPALKDVAGIASAVRKSLGVAMEDVDNKRLTRFIIGAKGLLAEPRATIDDSESLLAEVVTLAYHNTLGCAVTQGSSGDASFDSLANQSPTAFLTPSESEEETVRDEPKMLEPTTIRMLNDRLRMLLNPRTSPVTKFGFIESIAGLTDRVDDLAPDQAAALATYLLAKKRIEEHRAILPHVKEIGKWKQVRLGVADQLDEVGINGEQLQAVVSQLLGRDYVLESGDAGRESLRVDLLQSALADAKKQDVGDQDKFRIYDDAAQALYDFYTSQAILVRTTDWPEEPVTPSVVARSMIESRVKALSDAKLAAEGKKQLQQVDIDLRSVDYLATNDLQRLIYLDRLCLRLLAVEFASEEPSRAAEGYALVEQLAKQDRAAKHIMIQMRDGQAAILRMWLLRNGAEGGF